MNRWLPTKAEPLYHCCDQYSSYCFEKFSSILMPIFSFQQSIATRAFKLRVLTPALCLLRYSRYVVEGRAVRQISGDPIPLRESSRAPCRRRQWCGRPGCGYQGEPVSASHDRPELNAPRPVQKDGVRRIVAAQPSPETSPGQSQLADIPCVSRYHRSG